MNILPQFKLTVSILLSNLRLRTKDDGKKIKAKALNVPPQLQTPVRFFKKRKDLIVKNYESSKPEIKKNRESVLCPATSPIKL